MQRRSLIVTLIVLAGCGGGDGPSTKTAPATNPDANAPPADTRAGRQYRARVDTALAAVEKRFVVAASTRDVQALVAAGKELDVLAARQAFLESSPPSGDPFEDAVDSVPIKRAPLFVFDVTTIGSGHTVYVGLQRGAFCIRTLPKRLEAVRAVYEPLAERAGKAGIADLVAYFRPTTAGEPRTSDALAIGRAGTVTLTKAGRTCF